MGLFKTLGKALKGEIDLIEEMKESVKRQTAIQNGEIYIPPRQETKPVHINTREDDGLDMLKEIYGDKIFTKMDNPSSTQKQEPKNTSSMIPTKATKQKTKEVKQQPEFKLKDDSKYKNLVKQIQDTISFYAEDRKITIQTVKVKEYNRFITIKYQFDTRGLKNIGKLISDFESHSSFKVRKQKGIMKYAINVVKDKGYFRPIFTEDLLDKFQLNNMNFIVGEIDGGIVTANLKEVSDSHLFINGGSGSGKSAFLMNLLISLHYSTRGAEFYGVTPKADSFGMDFTTINSLLKENIFINDYETNFEFIESVLGMFEYLYERYSSRMRGRESSSNPIFIFFDEVQSVTLTSKEEKRDNPELYEMKMRIRQIIGEFSSKSRSANMLMIFGTQTVRTDVFNGRDLSNFTKITFKTNNSTEVKMLPELPASNLLAGAGHGLIRINGELFEFQSPMPDITRYQ